MDKCLARNFPVLFIIRKLLTGFFLVFPFGNAKLQCFLVVLTYVVFVLYLIIASPFRSKKLMLFMIFVEVIMLVIHLVFLGLIMSKKAKGEVRWSNLMMFLILMLLIAYLIFALISLCMMCKYAS